MDQGARSFRAVVTLKCSGEGTLCGTDVRTVEEWETVSVLEELGMDELAQLAQAGEALPVVWQMPEGNELLADYCQGGGTVPHHRRLIFKIFLTRPAPPVVSYCLHIRE